MANTPWSLPEGFGAAESKALKAIFEALRNAKKNIPDSAFQALNSGNIDEFLRLVDWDKIKGSLEGIQPVLEAQAVLSARSQFKQSGVYSNLRFDLIDQRAIDWAKQHVASLVRQVEEEMRQSIRDAATEALSGGLTVDEMARKIRTGLPLLPRDKGAVTAFEQRQLDKLLASGMKPEKAKIKASERAARYSEKLVRNRSKTIARTEIITASNEGRYAGWEAGMAEGYTDPNSKKEWIAEADACDICAPMDGMVIRWDKDFPIGKKMAPAHPNCRCSVTMLPPDVEETPYNEQTTEQVKESDPLHPTSWDSDLEVDEVGQQDWAYNNQKEYIQFGIGSDQDVSDALVDYSTTGGFEDLNADLRSGKALSAANERKAGLLDQALMNEYATFTRDITTFRGLDDTTGFFANLKAGNTFTDRGFISTSLNPKVPEIFTLESAKPTVLEIRVPQGSNALSMEGVLMEISDGVGTRLDADQAEMYGFTAVNEVLLPRNTTFEVLSTREQAGARVVEVKVTGVEGYEF